MKKRTLLSILCLFIFAGFQVLKAQNKVQLIDQYFTKATQNGFSGVALVAQNGKIIFKKGYGLANREKAIMFSPSSVFDIGSITKQFTGAAILKLEMEGKLKTSDLLSKYLTDLPQAMQKITLHHLLTHSAGLPGGIGSDEELLGKKAYLKRLYSTTLPDSFGSFAYSNTGYSLLAMVIEKVSGMSYETFLHKKLFKPAGMTQTGYVLPKWQEKDIVIGYQGKTRWGATHRKSQYHKGVTYHLKGNGGIMSTVLDMHKWYQAIKNHTVLSKKATKRYVAKHIQESDGGSIYYGYGWGTRKKPGREITWHTGGNDFFNDYMGFYLKEDLMIMVADNYGVDSERYARQIDRIMHGEFKQLSTKTINTYTGVYQLPSGSKVNVRFNADNQLVLPLNRPEFFYTFSRSFKEDKAVADNYNAQTKALLTPLLTENYAAYAKLEHQYVPNLSEAQIKEEIKEDFNRTQQMMGKLKSVEILGSVARRGGTIYLTVSKFTFEKDVVYFSYFWKDNLLLGSSRGSTNEMIKNFDHQKGNEFYARSNQLKVKLITKDGQPALAVGKSLIIKKISSK